MSISVMTEVWARSTAQGRALLAMLAIADWSDDDGRAWPKVDKLAAKARVSTRTLSRLLAALEESGELEVPRGPRSEERPYIVKVGRFAQISQNGRSGDQTPLADLDQTLLADSARARHSDVVEPSIEPSTTGQESMLPNPNTELWDHYRTRVPEGQKQFTPERKREVRAALKARDLDTCKRAVDWLAQSRWHHGDNPNGVTYLELKYAIGKIRVEQSVGDHIDECAKKAPVSSASSADSSAAFMNELKAKNRILYDQAIGHAQRCASAHAAGEPQIAEPSVAFLAALGLYPVLDPGTKRVTGWHYERREEP